MKELSWEEHVKRIYISYRRERKVRHYENERGWMGVVPIDKYHNTYLDSRTSKGTSYEGLLTRKEICVKDAQWVARSLLGTWDMHR